MRYPHEDMTQVLGIGQYLGEVRQGPDGNAYQWVEGIDGLGRRGGFWRRLRRRAKKAFRRVKRVAKPILRKALPLAQQVTSFIPHPYAKAASAGLTVCNSTTASSWCCRI